MQSDTRLTSTKEESRNFLRLTKNKASRKKKSCQFQISDLKFRELKATPNASQIEKESIRRTVQTKSRNSGHVWEQKRESLLGRRKERLKNLKEGRVIVVRKKERSP